MKLPPPGSQERSRLFALLPMRYDRTPGAARSRPRLLQSPYAKVARTHFVRALAVLRRELECEKQVSSGLRTALSSLEVAHSSLQVKHATALERFK
eukprot:SAG11_NODE_32006_length_287_cov_0.819149_1_plen_95_part_11